MRGPMLILLVLAILCYLAWCCITWFNSPTRYPEPAWRSRVAAVGFVLASGSSLVYLVGGFYALAVGGFPHYHPLLVTMIRVGFFVATAGFLFGILGKGMLRMPTLVASVAMAVVWFVTAGLE